MPRHTIEKELTDLEIKRIIEEDLTEYARVIRAIRSYHQHKSTWKDAIVSDTLEWEQREQLEEIEKYVEENANNRLYCGRSGLFEVFNNRRIWQDHISWRNYYSDSSKDIIRGFWVLLYTKKPELTFECVLLDAGKPIQTFEKLDEEAIKEFVSGFTRRRRGTLVYVGKEEDLPIAYCAVITEPCLCMYEIKRIQPFRFVDPYIF